jgi:hypothetical protein
MRKNLKFLTFLLKTVNTFICKELPVYGCRHSAGLIYKDKHGTDGRCMHDGGNFV